MRRQRGVEYTGVPDAIVPGAISIPANGGAGTLAIRHNGVFVGTEPALNFIDGSNVTLTVADDFQNREVDVTIAASGGSATPLCDLPPEPIEAGFAGYFLLDHLDDTAGTSLASHTPNIGGVYTKSAGSTTDIIISPSGDARVAAKTSVVAYTNGVTPPSPDIYVFARLAMLTEDNSEVRIGCRAASDLSAGYYVGTRFSASREWDIGRVDTGGVIASVAMSPAPSPGQTFDVLFSVVGTTLTLTVNGAVLLQTTASLFSAAGLIYLHAGNGTHDPGDAAGWHIQEFWAASSRTDGGGAYAGTSTAASRCDHVHEGVHSFGINGQQANLYGDVQIKAGTNISLTKSGQVITVNATGVAITANSDPVDVGSAAVRGSDTTHFANDDHVHKGVHSLAKSGSSALFGDVTVSEGANVTITQAGQNLQIAAAATAAIPVETLVYCPGSTPPNLTIPVSAQEFQNTGAYRTKRDLTNATQARIIVSLPNSVLYTGTPIFYVEYSTGGAWSSLDGAGGPSVSSPAIGCNVSGWVNLVAGAKGDVFLRVSTSDSGGPDTFAVGNIYVQYR